jgi:hypothetical protein
MVTRYEIKRRLLAHFPGDEAAVLEIMSRRDIAGCMRVLERFDRDVRIKRALIDTAGLSVRACAAELNRRGVSTPSDEGAWWPTMVVRERGLTRWARAGASSWPRSTANRTPSPRS